MREYRLEELFDLQMGKTPSRNNSDYWDDGTNDWISIRDLSNSGKYIEDTKEKLSDNAIEESGIKLIPENTVIMSFKLSIGKVAITTRPMFSNEAIMAFHDKGLISISPEYFYYLFLGKEWSAGSNKAVMGITLNKATLSKVKIKPHDFTTQQNIVNILNKSSEIIILRKRKLEELDNLIKSRFVEMFGDPIQNPMEWGMKTVDEVCSSIYGGGTPSKQHPEYYDGDIPWVTPKDMKSMFILDSIDHINELGINNSSTKLAPVDSILMVIRSGILKHTLPVAINKVPVTVNQDMKIFITNDTISTYFLAYLFKMIEPDVLTGVRAVTADNIDFTVFRNRLIPVPPIDLQNDYVQVVEQVDKLKVEVQKSLDETQILFDSLMQAYFE
ncbi:restriction endonuclease subunit S [Petrocella sp. FN5]|uniref:restriction endonuclease subunit S n=1 Tax=Petrocella sp. FN5 TaxID=3032002 RepID=UPI0023DC16BA|nr:restriction endonuclease subunit S [Petrocella sp. FN5]MDF1617316.1 restriction endonuclease subunit S [Petrocella sp. FN5]